MRPTDNAADSRPVIGTTLETDLHRQSTLYRPTVIESSLEMKTNVYKKLSYCWETVRRESMPRIAEMDVEMTT